MAKSEKDEMVEGIFGVLLKTRDLNKMAQFYSETVGLKVLDRDDDAVDLDLKAGRRLLLRRDASAAAGAGCTFVLKVKDAAKAHSKLAALKAPGLASPKDMSGALVVACADPDGNAFELVEMKGAEPEPRAAEKDKGKTPTPPPAAA